MKKGRVACLPGGDEPMRMPPFQSEALGNTHWWWGGGSGAGGGGGGGGSHTHRGYGLISLPGLTAMGTLSYLVLSIVWWIFPLLRISILLYQVRAPEPDILSLIQYCTSTQK